MTEFTDADWDCYAGAEAWHSSKPLIGGVEGLTVIADRNGIEVYLADGDADPEIWLLPLVIVPGLAMLISNTIITAFAKTKIFDHAALGFSKIS